MANNQLKYTRINPVERFEKRAAWNKAVYWPLWIILGLLVLILIPVLQAYRRRLQAAFK